MRHAMERPGVSSASSPVEEINEGPCGELSKILGPVIVWGCFISTVGENTAFFSGCPLGGSYG